MKTTPDNRYIVPWPPVVWVAPVSGKVYAGSGGTQIEVPAGTTREDIEEFFCWGDEARKYWDPSYSEENNSWEVKGSKGNKYTVTQKGPAWTCQCTGYRYRKTCKHIENLRILFSS